MKSQLFLSIGGRGRFDTDSREGNKAMEEADIEVAQPINASVSTRAGRGKGCLLS